METINLKINGIAVEAPKGSTILEAARLAHIEIPTLCFLKEINEIGSLHLYNADTACADLIDLL